MHDINHTQDLKKLNRIIRKYEKPLIHFAFSYTGDFEASEDYVLESFMEYWTNRDSLTNQANSNILAFILTVVKHKCLNHLRQRKYQASISDNIRDLYQWELDLQINSLSSCEPNELFKTEITAIVEDTLSKLPSDTRKIFIMSRDENKTRKEIAEIMNMSVKGVEYHISRALVELRTNLKDYLFYILLTIYN